MWFQNNVHTWEFSIEKKSTTHTSYMRMVWLCLSKVKALPMVTISMLLGWCCKPYPLNETFLPLTPFTPSMTGSRMCKFKRSATEFHDVNYILCSFPHFYPAMWASQQQKSRREESCSCVRCGNAGRPKYPPQGRCGTWGEVGDMAGPLHSQNSQAQSDLHWLLPLVQVLLTPQHPLAALEFSPQEWELGTHHRGLQPKIFPL